MVVFDAVFVGMFILPLIFTIPLIASLILVTKDPEPVYTTLYIIVTTVSFMVADIIYSSISPIPLLSNGGLQWIFSSLVQGFLALIGILGSFLIYHLQTLKDVSRQVRGEITKSIPNFDFSKVVVDDKSFLDYLKRINESKKSHEVKYAIYFLSLIMEERKDVNYMIRHQFILLFMTVFMSTLIIILVEGYYPLYGIFFKILIYTIVSVAMSALLSTVRGIFKLTQAGSLQ